MSSKVVVISGADFSLRWDGCFINLSDYEKIGGEDYEQELWDLFEYHVLYTWD